MLALKVVAKGYTWFVGAIKYIYILKTKWVVLCWPAQVGTFALNLQHTRTH